MSVDLQEPVGAESAVVPLDEFLTTHDEFTAFFGEVFDQLQALSLELFARHKCLEVSTHQKTQSDDKLIGYREEMLCLIEELQQFHANLQADQQVTQTSWMEIRAGYQQFIDDHSDLREVRDACRQIAGEFSGIKEEAQRERKEMHKLCANVESQLSQLTATCAALAETQGRQTNDGQSAELIEFTRQQQAEWLQQRAALEAELDALRRRAAEQAEALNEQKLLAGRQQAELSGELKRMRSLLETMGSEVRTQPVTPGESAKPADESSVLGSVLAQFEMLQRDINSRRMKRNNEPDPGGKPVPSA